ncbi:MAG: ferritin family protein [Chloroflexota bacterium]
MSASFTFKEILGKAVQKENESQLLYIDLSKKMQDTVSRDAFRDLARQELGHQKLLEQYQRGELPSGALSGEQTIDFRIAEHFYQPGISPGMQLKDIFLLAANREMHSHEIYLALARLHPAGEVKRLLTELASQELEHKRRVEFLFTEVAFPQTDGG